MPQLFGSLQRISANQVGVSPVLMCAAEIADTSLETGQGMHGTFSRADTRNFQAAIGPDFKAHYADPAPISNADINPTLAHILGLTIAPKGGLYIPSLDGIRAVSFFLVFLAHAGLGKVLVPGGFGVTIFFLLSGFLITTLLRLEYQRFRRISLKDFYLRRSLRILPPLYVTLGLSMLIVVIWNVPTGIPFAATLSQALQYANYYQIYATHLVSMPGTGVFWSLAVEEHFYLLFPLIYIWMVWLRCPLPPSSASTCSGSRPCKHAARTAAATSQRPKTSTTCARSGWPMATTTPASPPSTPTTTVASPWLSCGPSGPRTPRPTPSATR